MTIETETPTGTSTVEPSTVDGSLGTIGNEPLAQMVVDGVHSARITAEALLELRKRFTTLKKNEDILGYHSNQWQKFCEERLGITPSKARRWVAETIKATGEPHPAAKHDGSKNRTYEGSQNRATTAGSSTSSAETGTVKVTSRPLPPWTAKTPDGTLVEVARSAAQKAVRDGDEQAGVYWIRQLYLDGRDVWKALSIFAVEDIGIADLSVKTHILELQRLAENCKDERESDLLHVITAMMICCRSQKCRAADNAILWLNANPTWQPPTPDEIAALNKDGLPQPVIPDKVYDKHTARGRKLGRGMEHFLSDASALRNESDVAPFTPPSTDTHCNGRDKVAA